MSTSAWQRLDPRRWSTTCPRATVAGFTVATAVMLYGNVLTQTGGVVDDPILDTENPYRQSDLYVRDRRADGFLGQESVLFLLKYPDGIRSVADLERLRDFTDRVKREFGPAVLSLSEVDDYEDTGEALLRDPYIPDAFPADFDVEAWKRRVAADPMAFGTLVGRRFDWAAVVRYLSPGYDDIAEYRQTVEFIEQRTVPAWEWAYKTDVEMPENVGLVGGLVVRGLFDQGLRVDNGILVGVGVALSLPLLAWFLGSTRAALIGVFGVVLLGFVWTRGTIGLLQACGFDVRERLFTLLAYTNCIVQGVSFVLHKFEAYNEVMRATDRPADVKECWRRADGNDHLIAATALIAGFGFATLYTFQVVSIRELGLFSALGVLWLLALAVLFVPALHITLTPGPVRPIGLRDSRGAVAFRRALDWGAHTLTRLVTCFPSRATAWAAGAATLGTVLLAVGMIWPGSLMVVKMVPSKLYQQTVVGATGEFLDAPGRLGRDAMQFLVEPRNGSDIYDPDYLAAVASLAADLQGQPGLREVVSSINFVRHVSLKSLKKPLPTSREEAGAVFNLIEGDLSPAIVRQLYYNGGIRLTAHFVGDDSVVWRAMLEHVLQAAQERHPTLRVSPFGKDGQYPHLDRYIRNGKPLNVFGSQWVVIAFCWLGVWLNNRSRWARAAVGPYLSPWLGGVFMSIPFLFASAVIAIVMIVLSVPLDMGTASIAALAINASVDFSIYYADAYQRGLADSGAHVPAVEYAMRHKGRIVLQDTLLNSICFMPLLASRFEPIRDVGWIMMVMLGACAVGAVTLMPALFYGGLRDQPLPPFGVAGRRRAAAMSSAASRE